MSVESPAVPPVSVIVPVFNGYEAVVRLSATLFAHTDRRNDIVFIDDASTDPHIATLLAGFAEANPNVRVVRNKENLGFSHNVNLGASLSERDFVMLNSDTEVPPSWIPRLFHPIWSTDYTASATPFASWSKSHGFMENPEVGRELCMRYGIEAVDRVLSALPADPLKNAIVRGHGFCMAISRRAWNAVGPFNEELFGRGYGEETDWCLRASEHGFVNRLVPNLLVGHWHNGSFDPAETRRLIAEHKRIIHRLHPNAPRTRCCEMPAFIFARSCVRDALKKAGMMPDPPHKQKEVHVMNNPFTRFVRFAAGFLPCSRREFARHRQKLRDKIDRLTKKNKCLNEKVGRYSEKIKRQTVAINRILARYEKMQARYEKMQARYEKMQARYEKMQARLVNVQAHNADSRYLANIALSREKLRESVVRWWYAKNPGVPLNLDAPQTFCDKIQCLKLTADTPLLTRLADKYAVREWVVGKIGTQHLIPLLGVWDRAEDVDFDALPQHFVLKANHGSHMICIVKDKTTLDIPLLRATMSNWLATDYAFVMSPQLQYANIPRKIIAEEYIENSDGELHDWKVWCFRGSARYVEFMSRKNGCIRFVYMDREWRPAPFSYRRMEDERREPPPRPDNLDELLRLAEKLAAGFEFVRVDFYQLDDGSYRFGEMTFSPAGGNAQFDPPEYNAKIGALFDYTPDNRMPGAPVE